MALYVDATVPKSVNDFVSVLSFGAPKTNASGGKNVAIFKDRAIFTFTGPTVTTYGVNENNFDAGKPPTYDITLQLNDSAESMAFIQNMLDLERRIKSEAFKNAFSWFGRKISEEVINEFWTPFVKYPKKKGSETGELDMTKSPTVRFKFAYFEGNFKYIEAYNTSGELIFPKNGALLPELIPKGSEVKGLFRCNGIWFAGGKFGMTCKPIQLVVRPKARIMPGVCHLTMSGPSSSTVQLEDEPPRADCEDRSEEVKVSVDDSDDEDPDKEYVSTPAEHTEQTSSESVPPVPVKRRPRVKKEDA